MKNLYLLVIGLLFLSSCKTSKIKKNIQLQDYEHHVGVLLTDTKTGEILFSHNEKKAFVPASNTKILSLYASLETLGDSIPAFKYFVRNDTTFVLGTGDPTLLHPDFDEGAAIKILKNAKVLVISDQNEMLNPYGAGWAWDDYNDYYQAEISALPIYGNVVRASVSGSRIDLRPDYFNTYLKDSVFNANNVVRDEHKNIFRYDKNKVSRAKQEIPFKTSFDLTAKLLSEAIGVPVVNKHFEVNRPFQIAYSHPVDTVLRKMMQQSDNLLAEQLLLLAGGTFTDTVSVEISIKHLSKKLLSSIESPYRWRDGSGLSRYNLFSPQLMVSVLNQMYSTYPQERLFSLMSIGGKAGTLRNKYKSDVPYIFAKTGSMGGVYNESGYMIAKSGRLLTYSVMRNNFTGTVAENGAKTMQLVSWLREKY